MKIIAKSILVGLVLIILTFNYCKVEGQQKKSIKEVPASGTPLPDRKAPKFPVNSDKLPKNSDIAPGHCRIIGKVIAISPQPDASVEGVCGQTPCRAKVKLLKIIGYGHSFNQVLAENQEINVYFTFSLQPSKKYFPDMTTPLPGLKVGSSFQADISSSDEVGGTSVPWYQVDMYEVK